MALRRELTLAQRYRRNELTFMRPQLTFGVKGSLLGVSTSLFPFKVRFLRGPNRRDFASSTYRISP
jgi:hypothetical protein